MNKILIGAIAITSWVAAPAHAASSAQSRVTDFSIQLIDLNLTDGVGPGISWTFGVGNNGVAYRSLVLSSPQDSLTLSDTRRGDAPWGAASSFTSGALGSAGAAIVPGAGSDPAIDASLIAIGSVSTASSPGQSFSYASDAYPLFQIGSPTNFTLSANTLAVFRAQASGSATTTGSGPIAASVGFAEYAHSSASLTVSGPAASAGADGSQRSVSFLQADANSTAWQDPLSGSWQSTADSKTYSGTLGVSFANMTSDSMGGYLSLLVSTYGSSSIPAVPEPETYALMLAGLGVLGFMSRRRRKRG